MIDARLASVFSVIALVIVFALSLAIGSKYIPIEDVITALTDYQSDTFNSLVIRERIPRAFFGILAGAALGVCGTLMQSVTQNPIADPGILGINNGAALFVVSAMAFLHISTYVEFIVAALLGATITTILVYFLANNSKPATPIKLALSGVAVRIVLSALTTAVMLPRAEVLEDFRFWQVGSLSSANNTAIFAISPFLLIGFSIVIYLTPSLELMSMGDEMATTLGVNVSKVRLLGVVSSVLLCATITAVAGPISFVGLIIPHITGYIVKNNFKLTVIFSAFLGAIILLSCDIIGRVLGSPGELYVGIVTAFVGAPFLIYLTTKKQVT